MTNVGGTSAENVIVEITVGDVTREMNLDLVAKGDTESATVVVPADADGPATRRSRELHQPLSSPLATVSGGRTGSYGSVATPGARTRTTHT